MQYIIMMWKAEVKYHLKQQLIFIQLHWN